MIRIDLKPLSVNKAWKGQRFKTDEYKQYERDALFLLPKITLPNPPYKLTFEFGFSNMASDIDNPVKSINDILQKKYGFNDKEIHRLEVNKVAAPKGSEYFKFLIETLN